jgi:hypothetical protein
MRSQMRLIVCRATMAACSFQVIKTMLDPFHGDRLEHIPHALERVDQPSAVRDFGRALPHFTIHIAHFLENAGQAVEVPNPRSRSGLAGSALPFCLRCHAFASLIKAAAQLPANRSKAQASGAKPSAARGRDLKMRPWRTGVSAIA